ncbi:hypothetical protein ACFRAQ_12005 [Nocardia sp. NPDC056611]|uniref:hypothetical protein n=1 Tax=Nocardia sp. NPDC056611 TaxID=3345877 RepID=UPI00366DF648
MTLDDLIFVALAIFLSSWLTLSALCQIPRDIEKWEATRWERWIRTRDVCGLIPRWHFFAPTPATDDLHLLYRDRLPDGRITRWRQIPPGASPKWIGPVWNPRRRQNKALIDISVELGKTAVSLAGDTAGIQLSLAYIATLNFVSGLPRDYRADGTQFLIMRSKGMDEDVDHDVIFLSPMHSSEPALSAR